MAGRVRWFAWLVLACAACTAPVASPGASGGPRAPGRAVSPVATPLPPVLPASNGWVSGQILDEAGNPAAGVAVAATLITKPRLPVDPDGNPLLSQGGARAAADQIAGVVGTSGATLRPWGLLQAAEDRLTTRSDAQGRFSMKWSADAEATLEAVAGPTRKALAQGIRLGATVTLRLGPTGTLRGRLLPPTGAAVSNMQGILVAVPGTSYVARTDAAGAFTLDQMPAGTFVVTAERAGLGEATSAPVTLRPGEAAEVPPMQFVATTPTITRIEPTNGGPGTRVTVVGERFGASSGKAPTVTVGGVVAQDLELVDDRTLRFTVPREAGTGGVIVSVGGVASAPAAFRPLRSLRLTPTRLELLPGDSFTFGLEALDAEGQPVASPTWQVTGSDATVEVDPSGRVKALTTGLGGLSVRSGDLAASAVIRVVTSAKELTGSDERLSSGMQMAVVASTAFVTVQDGVLAVVPGRPAQLFTSPELALDGPDAIAPDGAGGLVVAGERQLFRLSAGGAVKHLAGARARTGFLDGLGAEATFTDIEAICRAPGGRWAVFDQGRLRFVTPEGVVTTWQPASGTTPGFFPPAAYLPTGELVHVDPLAANGSGWLRGLDPAGELSPRRAVKGLFGITAMACAPDGTLWMGSDEQPHLYRLDPPASLTVVPRPDAGLNVIDALAFDETGALWALDTDNRKVVPLGIP